MDNSDFACMSDKQLTIYICRLPLNSEAGMDACCELFHRRAAKRQADLREIVVNNFMTTAPVSVIINA